MNAKKWMICFFALLLAGALLVAGIIFYVDPAFHFHGPRENLYYHLSEQRFINDGITRHFSYDGLITGTSMTEKFKTSQAESLFGGSFIKIPYAGGSYKEINDAVEKALQRNPQVKTVIRGLDRLNFFNEKDLIRTDMGVRPTYLYDENPFNDVQYLLNKRFFLLSCKQVLLTAAKGPGIDSFDEYSNIQEEKKGADEVLKWRKSFPEKTETIHLTKEERQIIEGNIRQNVLHAAIQNPQVDFYYFIPPYSAAWWGAINSKGGVERELEAERLVLELLLDQENIHLYSYCDRLDISGDLSRYSDTLHYDQGIFDHILDSMKKGEGLLTKENYEAYLKRMEAYLTYDYNGLFRQCTDGKAPKA